MSFYSPVTQAIHRSIARAVFVSEWASDEESQGRPRSGKLEDQAPETPEEALYHAAAVIGAIEEHHGVSLAVVYSQACKADGVDYTQVCHTLLNDRGDIEPALAAHPADFGFCIGMMSLGDGVSWFDNHEEFEVQRGFGETKPFYVPAMEFEFERLRYAPEVASGHRRDAGHEQ